MLIYRLTYPFLGIICWPIWPWNTLRKHFIRYTHVVVDRTQFFLQKKTNSLRHKFNKVLRVLIRDFGGSVWCYRRFWCFSQAFTLLFHHLSSEQTMDVTVTVFLESSRDDSQSSVIFLLVSLLPCCTRLTPLGDSLVFEDRAATGVLFIHCGVYTLYCGNNSNSAYITHLPDFNL